MARNRNIPKGVARTQELQHHLPPRRSVAHKLSPAIEQQIDSRRWISLPDEHVSLSNRLQTPAAQHAQQFTDWYTSKEPALTEQL
jgi:hypothetical protein